MGTLRNTEPKSNFNQMPVKQTIPYFDGIFSITFTCANWLPLIEKVNGYDLVYHWFNHLKEKGHFIVGYVIIPNPHLTGRAGCSCHHCFSKYRRIHKHDHR